MSENVVSTREGLEIARLEQEADGRNIFGKHNKVILRGKIEKDFEYSHSVLYEKFYRTRVKVVKLSGREDLIPIVVSEKVINLSKNQLINQWVELTGEFRSRIDNSKLEAFLFVKSMTLIIDEDKQKNDNIIYLDGYICKPPIYRPTLLGRPMTNLFVAVKRAYNMVDYISCICWDRNAEWAKNIKVGKRVRLYGRIQSREYFKKFSRDSEEGEFRYGSEISVRTINKVLPKELA